MPLGTLSRCTTCPCLPVSSGMELRWLEDEADQMLGHDEAHTVKIL